MRCTATAIVFLSFSVQFVDAQETSVGHQAVSITKDHSPGFESSSVPIRTKVVRGRLPLSLTIPDDFIDATKLIYEESARPDYFVYCDPSDAQLIRDQLRGQRIEVGVGKGCLVVYKDSSSFYDKAAQRFSFETPVFHDAMGKWKTNRMNGYEHRENSLLKTTVRGVPVIAYDFEVRRANEINRTRYLFIANESDLWAVIFNPAKQDDISTAIWNDIIRGL